MTCVDFKFHVVDEDLWRRVDYLGSNREKTNPKLATLSEDRVHYTFASLCRLHFFPSTTDNFHFMNLPVILCNKKIFV